MCCNCQVNQYEGACGDWFGQNWRFCVGQGLLSHNAIFTGLLTRWLLLHHFSVAAKEKVHKGVKMIQFSPESIGFLKITNKQECSAKKKKPKKLQYLFYRSAHVKTFFPVMN